ncbi:hypothetical protein T12_4280 [Trichinella patagoniensis]|uniref:Uncharacterized protein n=1 Tax=Trichinella patagoniensis TaxID=990121 RepID=A0A0V0YVD3_9BILA|nr:hypothetical protein T12_4280 [Trichinella patagoniensis]
MKTFLANAFAICHVVLVKKVWKTLQVPSRATLQSNRLNLFVKCMLHALSARRLLAHQLDLAPTTIAPTVQLWTPKCALTSSLIMLYLCTLRS